MENQYGLDVPSVKSEYLYFYGGYNSIDKGVPDWGSNNEHDSLLIGDKKGSIVIRYKDNTINEIPLIFGYTMWWHQRWNDATAPLKGNMAFEDNAKLLQKTLYLYGGFEGLETGILRVKVKNAEIDSIFILNNKEKMGKPLFYKVTGVCEEINAQEFFSSHTIDSEMPLPIEVKSGLDSLFSLLHHTEEELKTILPAEAPIEFVTKNLSFDGSFEAKILTNVFRDNSYDMICKIDEDGAFNASTKNSFCWGRYDGFGTWIEGTANFYGKVYSRDCGRGVMSLIDSDYLKEASEVIDYFNKKLMFFPDNFPELTFDGKKIPGHWTVIVNEPMVYSEYLTTVGWPTQYTKEKFGDEYKNLGNLETDGHGLTMLAVYKYYLTTGKDVSFIRKNWEFIKEAAEFIVWCLDNPSLSFSKDDVLYGETEAAMNDYTLYANMPCCFGMLFYSKMARAAGLEYESEKWQSYHERLYRGINKKFYSLIDGKECWDLNHCGFFHDPVLTILSDFYGYDRNRFPYKNWVIRSENTYEYDLARYAKNTYAAPRGLGYDFNIIAQNSLLLDRTHDYSLFVKNLAKTCYAPKFIGRYLTPEGATVLTERGVYRREGDLGNLAQQSETIKTVLVVCGIFEMPDKTVYISPRMPDKCSFSCNGFRAVNSPKVTVNMNIEYQDKHELVTLSVNNLESDQAVVFRGGPFSAPEVKAQVNGKEINITAYKSGDSYWTDIPLMQYKSTDKLNAEIVFKE